MTVEEIAIRQEVRQMLQEAGYNKEVMKDIVKKSVEENLDKAIKQCFHEMNIKGIVEDISKDILYKDFTTITEREIRQQIQGICSNMKVTVEFI